MNEEAEDTAPKSESSDQAIEPETPSRGIVEFAGRNSELDDDSVAAFVRWWQLETWLRQLAYVELRSRDGASWDSFLEPNAHKRMGNDRAQRYMATPDLDNPLAYLDASKLFDLIEQNWSLFDDVLIDHDIWQGRRAELVKIRHRIGHMRRPHDDDVRRLEQTLRDLEQGAFAALASYNSALDQTLVTDRSNAVVDGWINKSHPAASRLIDHAERTRDISFELSIIRRPWAAGSPATGREPGYLWRVDFISASRDIFLLDIWRDNQLTANAKPLMLHMLYAEPSVLSAVFPFVDDPNRVSDAIGEVFDSVVKNSHPMRTPGRFDDLGERSNASTLDYRVKRNTVWNTVDSSTVPITIFGAQS